MRGRVAVVTGGTGALGQAIVARCLAAGAASVWVPWVVEAEHTALRARFGTDAPGRVEARKVDVLDESAITAFAGEVVAKAGRLDVLVNTVGGFAGGDLASTSVADWERMLRLNLTSAFVACRAVLPHMARARYGRIVNIASRAVVPPAGGFIGYTVSKAGVITLTQALAQEVRAQGITVNAVLPSTMDTPANRAAMPDADRSGWVTTDQVAAVVAFLAGDDAGALTGGAVPV
jgi:NAD(P)-dependent dehydrogenase (short-subunit alcohol dehydrogenase family)